METKTEFIIFFITTFASFVALLIGLIFLIESQNFFYIGLLVILCILSLLLSIYSFKKVKKMDENRKKIVGKKMEDVEINSSGGGTGGQSRIEVNSIPPGTDVVGSEMKGVKITQTGPGIGYRSTVVIGSNIGEQKKKQGKKNE